MTDFLPPFLLFFAGALLLPLLPRTGRNLLILLVPALAFVLIAIMEPGQSWHYRMFGFDLTLLRVDKLSKVFGYVYVINAFCCFLFAQHLKFVEDSVAADPTVLDKAGILALYRELQNKIAKAHAKFRVKAKKGSPEAVAEVKINARLKDAEVYRMAASVVEKLYRKLR